MTAVEQLDTLLDEEDPFLIKHEDLADLRLEAVNERLEERRGQIPVLDRRARDAGIDRVRSLDDLVPLLFAHSTYKSYPASFVAKGQWDRLTRWLDTLSARSINGVDMSGVSDVDEWIERLEQHGHYVYGSSGTSGKCSFLSGTLKDRQDIRRNIVQSFRWVTGFEPTQDRSVFIVTPHRTPQRHDDAFAGLADAYARPGGVSYLTTERITMASISRMTTLRRAIAEGSASPSEVAALNVETAARTSRMKDATARIAAEIAAHHQEPVVIFALFAQMYHIAAACRDAGVDQGDFHPETALVTGGGLKGLDLPSDWFDSTLRFFNLDMSRVCNTYGSQEGGGGGGGPKCGALRYHVLPSLTVMVLDQPGEVLLNPVQGRVNGRFAFFNPLTDGRWGGVVTGDRVTVDFDTCPCGYSGPTLLDDIVRYSEIQGGDDKITCAGTIEAYMRGVLDVR